MKTLFIAAVTFLSVQLIAYAAEEAVLPDFSKVYPEEKIAHKMNIKGIENYTYMTDLTFDEMKQGMVKFLAKGWQEEETDAEIFKQVENDLKQQGMEVLGYTIFANADFPELKVALMQMKMNVDLGEKKFIATVTVTGNKAE